MRKNILVPAVAVLGGAVGFFLRRWERSAAFEPETGLPITGSPILWAVPVWLAVMAVLILALTWREKTDLPFDRAFAAEGNMAYLVCAVVSAFLLLASAGAEAVAYPVFRQTTQAGMTTQAGEIVNRLQYITTLAIPLICCGLCVLGFVWVLLIAKNLFRALGKGKEQLSLLGLCLLFFLWPISCARSWSVDPVVQNHLYMGFAAIFDLLGLYQIATYSFQKGKPRRTLFCCLMGSVLSMVTLADSHTVAELLRYGFIILFLTIHAALLLGEHPAGETEEPAETEAV